MQTFQIIRREPGNALAVPLIPDLPLLISGSGKTTLLKLICGLYSIDKGGIYLNNVLIDKEDIGNLRRHTAYAPFDPILITGTFIDQVLFGNKQLSLNEVIYYATIAGVAEFVDSNQGYQRIIERGGSNLSSGQKQRLMLSTALAKQSDVIVIDEAMTNLDLEIKTYILDQIQLLSSDKVVIIVSHDPFVLVRCNKVYLLDKGEMIGCGH
ncbi:MAG: ATP-binding cassette domain-containing protein [Candidatus Cloacimonetes bacterium]|nr:ATP-binding cassette domain-containing protein [Candidatus Cloacimonadota bacterium]